MKLALKYSLFAAISTVLNLGMQFATFSFYKGPFELYIAMMLGTGGGLLSKYVLDKKYIFYHQTKDLKDDTKKFILYSAMGVITTLIFWGCEIGFDTLFRIPSAKYTGAVIGLLIGYVTKYNLDKRFVFVSSTSEAIDETT
jgi:putative flippase GtrA